MARNKEKRSKFLFMSRAVLAAVLALITASGAMSQVVIQVEPPGENHDREWYEHHGYHWHDGRWYREGEGEHRHHGYWKNGHWHDYDHDRD